MHQSRPSLTVRLSALLLLIATALPAMAQDAGGLRLAPGLNGGPVGLARPLPLTRAPLVTARDLQGGMTPADRQALNQSMISRVRGDAGYLGGFAFGAARTASRQPVQDWGADAGNGRGHRRPQPIVINNNGPLAVTVGNGNLVQQQSASGPGPIAQQQVATPGGAGGGALNLVSGGGNIIQRAPGGG